MDASSGQQHQDQMGTNSLENMLVCSKSQQQERKPRPQPEQALKCPRCDSTNTKFCYYNNYSLSQPRYFCKSCRRYWTKGGTLRNVPVGGGCRKNKRSSSSSTTTSSTSSASSKRIQDHLHQPLFTTDHIPNIINPLTGLPHLSYETNDLSLAFERLQKQNGGQMGGFDHDHDHQHHLHHHDFPILGGLNPSSNSPSPAFLDALRSGFLETHNNNINNNFQNLYYGYGGGNLGEIHENVSGGVNGGEMLQMTNYEDHHHHHHQHHNMSNSNTSNSSNATTTAVTVTTMKQEFCNNNSNNISSSRENDNKILWGFPWQLNNGAGGGGGGGDHHGNLVGGDLDSAGRESWNGFNSSNWHGLLNSPLM